MFELLFLLPESSTMLQDDAVQTDLYDVIELELTLKCFSASSC